MKLYTNKAFGNLFVDVVAVTASLSGVQVTEEVVSEEVAKSKEFKAKSLTGKFPLLETEQGTIVESAAIAKFIAKHSANNLVGSNNWETAQVDQFTDFASTSLIPHIRVIAQAIFGHGSIETEAFNNSVKELKEHVRVLNTHLQGKTYLVGDRLTVADVQVAFSLILAFQVALDGGFRKSVAPNVTAWLERFVALPEVVKRVGHVKFCAKPQKAVAPPKKEEEKKPAAAAAPKKEADAESAPIKAVDPLDELPPSKFDLMAFKTYFVNLPNDVKKTEGIDFFFKNYDNEGYCLYYAKYDKYEGEGEVLYQTSNLMNGFLQRIDSFRRHTFAMMAIVGEVPNLDIESVWLFRGKGIPQQMIDHPQFEYYNKRELSLDNEADKQLVKEFFCAQAGDTVNGKVVVECKAHK